MSKVTPEPPAEASPIQLQRRLTDVLSRIRFNLLGAAGSTQRQALEEASRLCAHCREAVTCQRWISEHEEGADNPPPDFCPNAGLMRSGLPE
jgi:hypothetical protein